MDAAKILTRWSRVKLSDVIILSEWVSVQT